VLVGKVSRPLSFRARNHINDHDSERPRPIPPLGTPPTTANAVFLPQVHT